VQKCIKTVQVNQIFNKVKGSNGKNKRDIVLNKIGKDKERWDLFTKKEEYDPIFLDKYGRFPYYLSNHRNIFEPEISNFLIQNGLNPEYPEGKKFAVCLTHDIDFVCTGMLNTATKTLKALKNGHFVEASMLPFSRINKKWSPLWNFGLIMELEEKYGAKSTFYFLTLDSGNEDFTFSIEELDGELGHILDDGWEVGLHGGHEAYNNPTEIKRKKQKLEKVLKKEVIGYRNHYLRFKTPETWELLAEAGFSYDSTFGYHDCAGFRNGMCHPFSPYNLNKGKEIDILEIPLNIMDTTLFSQMHLDFEQAWNLTEKLILTVERQRGVLTILWHNTYMQGDYLEFYIKILQYCAQKGAWMASAAQIFNWWKKNYGCY
jgi:peptidoglycan/xylan/chitin deacetylase (PgdA/CDA1 family)